MQVKDIMTAKVECISPQGTLQEAARKMMDLDVGALPVGKNHLLAGMVTDRDITVRGTAAGRDPATTEIQDVLTPEVVYCYFDQEVQESATIMKIKQIRRLVVLDGDNYPVGMVSLGDLAESQDMELTAETLECVTGHRR